MNTKTPFIFFIFFLSFAVNASALEAVPGWEPSCINGTHILKKADIYLNGTLYDFNQTITCPYGCDTGRDVCWKWPGEAIPGEYYLLFEAFVIVLLLIMIYRLDLNKDDIQIFDVVIPVLASGLFFAMALQGNNVIDSATGEAVRIIFVVWFNYGMGVFCLIPFFFALFKFIHKQVT